MLRRIRTLVFDVPRQAKLAYCLLRDPRVPPAPKAALLGAAGLIASPLDLPAWVPLVGELDVLALGVLATRVFIDACPEELVAEHREAIANRQSRFDVDFRAARTVAIDSALRTYDRWRARVARPARPAPAAQAIKE